MYLLTLILGYCVSLEMENSNSVSVITPNYFSTSARYRRASFSSISEASSVGSPKSSHESRQERKSLKIPNSKYLKKNEFTEYWVRDGICALDDRRPVAV
jgi:hypothetical protein